MSNPDPTDVDPAVPAPAPPRTDQSRLFTGRSGHLAVMAEFLHRGINVAVPEVDVGDDIYVVRENDETLTRVQVKTGNAIAQQDGSYFSQFLVSWPQLRHDDTPALVYVFAVRYDTRWSDFIVIRRAVLLGLHRDEDVGSLIKNAVGETTAVNFRLVFTKTDVQNKGISFASYRNAFEPWPPPELAV